MASELLRAIEQLASDKGLASDVIVEAVKEGMVATARKLLHKAEEAIIEAEFDEETGEVEVFEFREVVEGDSDNPVEISLVEAQAEDPDVEIGDSLGYKLDTSDFGRIAAQNAKQIIMSRLRDAERTLIEEEYQSKVGELITGIVRRVVNNQVIVELGRAEGGLATGDRLRNESYRSGDKIKCLVTKIDTETRGPEIRLSRAHPDFLRRLFELEVPEIYDGVVEIKALARDPGSRSKVAVASHDKDVDPVGASVGVKGVRVQNIVQELRGEKIDIIEWHDDAATLIENALSPAEISQVIIDDENHAMEVIVPDDQLSLAIGRRGQNVKLAVELTGWSINITSETDAAELSQSAKETLSQIPDITGTAIELLFHAGFQSIEDVAYMEPEEVAEATGLREERLHLYREHANEILKNTEDEGAEIDEEVSEDDAVAEETDTALPADARSEEDTQQEDKD